VIGTFGKGTILKTVFFLSFLNIFFCQVILFFCPVPINNEEIIDLSMRSSRKTKESKSMLHSYQRFRYEYKRDIAFKHSVMGLCKTHLSNNGSFDLVVLTLVILILLLK
jgi:hypothetical protein